MVKHWGDMLSDFKAAIGAHADIIISAAFYRYDVDF